MFDWERTWKSSGIQFAVLAVIALAFYGSAPKVGASNSELVSFFSGDRTRVLVASVLFCLSFLNLMWFGAALASVLRDAGKGGWAAAATVASAALGTMYFVRMTVRASLAFSIAGSGDPGVTSGLYDVSWALTVVIAFPAAMFVMAGAFGLWRAGIMSTRYFSVGVLTVVLVLLGGTTWASQGFWAPDGAYAVLAQLLVFLWVAVLSGFLVRRSTVNAPAGTALPAA